MMNEDLNNWQATDGFPGTIMKYNILLYSPSMPLGFMQIECTVIGEFKQHGTNLNRLNNLIIFHSRPSGCNNPGHELQSMYMSLAAQNQLVRAAHLHNILNKLLCYLRTK